MKDERSSESDDHKAAKASRRRFLRLLAVGSLAAVTGAAVAPRRARAAAASPAAKKKTAPAPAAPQPSAAVRKEIQNQKDYLARTLKVIRDYPLETGSPMAFTFRPLRVSRAHTQEKKS